MINYRLEGILKIMEFFQIEFSRNYTKVGNIDIFVLV